MLRSYDQAFIERIGAEVEGGEYKVRVKNLLGQETGLVVPVKFALPEEWWGKYELPGIHVRRMALLPDPSRRLPGFRGKERSESTPNTWNIQKYPSVPINILYEVELATEKQTHMNALVEHMLVALPPEGYGSFLTVFGTVIPFRQTAFKDRTKYETKEGRKFLYNYTYTVEAWLSSLECEKVPEVIGIDVTVEENDPLNDVDIDENS